MTTPPPPYGAYPPPPHGEYPTEYYGYSAGYPQPKPTNALAIVALVCAFVFAPLGILFGHISLSQIKKTGEEGRGLAIAGQGTNGSQFFLVYRDSMLPPTYTVFGTIDATGLATLDKVAADGVVDGSGDGKPARDVTIESVRLD